MLCLVRKSLILLFKKRLFKTLYTMYSTVHSKATVTGHQIVPADRQLKIAQLGVCWEAPSFQESLEPHLTEDTSSGVTFCLFRSRHVGFIIREGGVGEVGDSKVMRISAGPGKRYFWKIKWKMTMIKMCYILMEYLSCVGNIFIDRLAEV